MRWLCFLLASSAAAQAKPLTFDVAALAARRDSFAFYLNGEERGYAVWQYEVRGSQLVFTAVSELRPVEAESLRVVVDRSTGTPVATFHRIAWSNPRSDTLLVQHDLRIDRGRVAGSRRVATRDEPAGSAGAVRQAKSAFPPGTVLSDYGLFAAAVTNLAPGDSGVVRAYSEFGDSLFALTIVAEAPDASGVLPLRSGDFRIYVTRAATPGARRVVKGESLDGAFRFALVQP